MNEIICVINQKGGVGKSTTCQNFAVGLHQKGYSVLLIELDAQGNLSYSMGVNKKILTSFEVLKNECTIQEASQNINGIDIVPASISLAGADMVLIEIGKEFRLKEAIEPVKNNYDYIIIDTPPALGILTINALTCSTTAIIPAQADIYSLDAIGQLYNTIKTVKQYTNKELLIKGIILTRFSNRAVLSRDLASMINDTAVKLETKLFKTTIREAIAIKEAQANKQDIFTYSGTSKVADDYRAFVNEFLDE